MLCHQRYPRLLATTCERGRTNGDAAAWQGVWENEYEYYKECKRLCAETIALRQYVEEARDAELFKWTVTAGSELGVKNGVLCFKTEKDAEETPDKIFVPVAVRVPLIQGIHVDTQAGHLGHKRALAKLR